MHPADIKAELQKVGITQAELANSLGVSPTAVHRVIWDLSPSKRIAKKISKAIHKPLTELWPDRYGRQ